MSVGRKKGDDSATRLPLSPLGDGADHQLPPTLLPQFQGASVRLYLEGTNSNFQHKATIFLTEIYFAAGDE